MVSCDLIVSPLQTFRLASRFSFFVLFLSVRYQDFEGHGPSYAFKGWVWLTLNVEPLQKLRVLHVEALHSPLTWVMLRGAEAINTVITFLPSTSVSLAIGSLVLLISLQARTKEMLLSRKYCVLWPQAFVSGEAWTGMGIFTWVFCYSLLNISFSDVRVRIKYLRKQYYVQTCAKPGPSLPHCVWVSRVCGDTLEVTPKLWSWDRSSKS